MTLFELSDQYEYSAALLRRRIAQLDVIRGRTPDRDARAMLDERQRVLRGMWREMRELTRLTRRYYDCRGKALHNEKTALSKSGYLV